MKVKILVFIAFLACIAIFGYIKAEQGDYSTMGYNTVSGYSLWRVDSSGHLKPGYASTYDIGTAALPVRTIYVGAVTGTGAMTATTIVASGYIQPYSKTIAQLHLITPTAKGQVYVCSDCATSICVSSGTGTGAFTTVASTTTVCS